MAPVIRRKSAALPKSHATRVPTASITTTLRQAVDIHKKLTWEYVPISDIRPYAFNARDNEKAIPAVAESIKTFGFLIPVVIDANGELIAGHTRVEAAKLLNMTDVPSLRVEHLTEDQIKQFRLIDNKVASIATWDFDLLGAEMASLKDSGIDFTAFGWNQEEIDCLSDVVAADCLEGSEAAAQAQGSTGNETRRAPITARCVIGEMVFFIPASEYRTWADGIRNLNEFNEVAIVNDIKRRLGMTQ